MSIRPESLSRENDSSARAVGARPGMGPRPVEPDPLLAFRAEAEPTVDPVRVSEPPVRIPPRIPDESGTSSRTWITAAAVLAVLAGTLVYFQAARRTAEPAAVTSPTARPANGTAIFSSQPVGVDVLIDGERRGVTPLTLALPAGEHQVEFVSGDQRRAQPLVIAAGATNSHFVEFAARAAAGRLEVASEPSGARVTIDGVVRGVTPLVLSDLQPGSHTVAVTRGDRTLRRTVSIAAGATSTVMMTATQSAGPEAGWVVFRAPFEMQVMEDGRLLGTTGADRLMLPVGPHELTIAAGPYNFRETRSVIVEAGAIAPVSIDVPTASLSVNAQPWADVWIDGRSVGTTPLGNLSIAVGPHEVLWRHPQLGERRRTIAVAAGAPTRISTDFK